MLKKKIIAIIPAKTDSKRMPNKNMTLLAGKPLLYHTIKFAKSCSLIDKVYISTDSSDIAKYAKREGVDAIMRSATLCGETPVVKVYYHALINIKEEDIEFIVGLQPDHPNRKVNLDAVIRYVQNKNLDDLISVDSKGNKNGSIRIMKASALRNKQVSMIADSIVDDATNIHTLGDFKLAELRLKAKNSIIKIKNKIISDNSPTFIIAEGACNHICDMNLAKKMIDEAENCGADAIKFQTYKAERLVSKDAKTYWNYKSTQSQYEYYKNLDKFDKPEYKILFDYARDKNIVVFSSPFDIQSADMLNDLDMPLFKIASCLIPDTKLIKHISGFKKPIILSVGACEIDEIKDAIDAVYSHDNFSLILLACTLSYPTRNEDAHLMRIKELKEKFPDIIVGYSDHTEPDENMVIPSIAVSLGAKVIEKHYTLDRTMTGSGHSFSVDPPLLKKMFNNIRLTEKVMGSEKLGVMDVEQQTRQSARMSIVAKGDIKKNEEIKEEMLTAIRPGTGIFPKFMDRLVGKKSKRDIQTGGQIKWDDIE